MRRPRIGIPLCLDDRGRWRPGRDYAYADQAYASAIDRAGGLPLFLPIQSSPREVVESLDGLLIPGGDDLPAMTERGERSPEPELLDLAPEVQVEFDTALLEAARTAGRPILGICYGMQLMARSSGGKLHTHLPSQAPDATNHKLASWDARHPIEIDAGSRLAAIFDTTRFEVNSLHHQAVREPGAGFEATARSEDGVIEGIESSPDGRFEIGVQWHPEKMNDASSERLFRAFIDACRSGGEARKTG